MLWIGTHCGAAETAVPRELFAAILDRTQWFAMTGIVFGRIE